MWPRTFIATFRGCTGSAGASFRAVEEKSPGEPVPAVSAVNAPRRLSADNPLADAVTPRDAGSGIAVAVGDNTASVAADSA